MKSILLSLLMLTSLAQADDMPLFAKLQVEGVSSNMMLINPRFGLISEAEISIDDTSVKLTISKKMPECPLGMFCPQIMPSNVTVYLNIIQVIESECSTKYIAATSEDVLSLLHEEVVVEDFSFTTCERSMRALRAPGIITYKVTGISSQTQQRDTAGARFLVHGGFVRPIFQP